MKPQPGTRFGRWVLIWPIGKRPNSSGIYWSCRCACGAVRDVRESALLAGATSKCRHCQIASRKKVAPTSLKADEVGKQYGNLRVVSLGEQKIQTKRGTNLMWNCRCICGGKVVVSGVNLRRGHVRSCGCALGLAPGEAAFNHLLLRYQRNARQRELDFELSLPEVRALFAGDCYYCGRPPATIHGRGLTIKGVLIYNGIDRMDNMLGYTVANSVSCCGTCNWMKRTLSVQEFLSLCHRIARRHQIP